MNLEHKLAKIKAQGHFRELKPVERLEGKWLTMDGQKLLNFTSNDYLGLGQAPFSLNVTDEEHLAVFENLASSRWVSGNAEIYEAIETTMCQHFGFEAALITNSGYDANLAVFQAFQDESVVVFSDAKNHASLIDGIRLSRIDKEIYRHRDVQHLENLLAQYPNSKTKIIVTDSVFSTNGGLADLQQLVQLKKHYPNTWLFVDDAHAFGLRLHPYYEDIDILTTSLSKAVGAHGGAILCSALFKTVLINTARALIYSSALPLFNLYRIQNNLSLMLKDTERSQKLQQLSQSFNELYAEYTQKCYPEMALSPIKQITFTDNTKAVKAQEQLSTQGILLSLFRYPTVQQPILRISLSWLHHKHDIERLFEVMEEIQ